MVETIVFSKNRALQLDASLRSFQLHCQDPELTSLNVIYHASTTNIERQYQTLKAEFPRVKFVREQHFRDDLETVLLEFYEKEYDLSSYRIISSFNRSSIGEHRILRKIGRGFVKLGINYSRFMVPVPKGDKFILFMVDDNLFVRPFKLETMISMLHSFPDAIGFSLRLGRNTTYSYMQDRNQKLPEFDENGNGVLSYNWTSAQYDFSYPLEISSSLYRAEQILPLMALIPFQHPNVLEEEMAVRSRWFSNKFPKLLCFERSIAFCNPINKVQTNIPGNRAGENSVYSVEELAKIFDKGGRVDVEVYTGFCPNSCHQEVKLEFIIIK